MRRIWHSLLAIVLAPSSAQLYRQLSTYPWGVIPPMARVTCRACILLCPRCSIEYGVEIHSVRKYGVRTVYTGVLPYLLTRYERYLETSEDLYGAQVLLYSRTIDKSASHAPTSLDSTQLSTPPKSHDYLTSRMEPIMQISCFGDNLPPPPPPSPPPCQWVTS